MPDSLSTKLTPRPELVCQELDGEIVILDMQQEQYFGLNAVGARMWQLMSAGENTDQIIETIKSEFEVTEDTIRTDLTALCGQLTDAGLLTSAA